LRLGVTGLSRSGKTVFITALLHGLLRGGRFPVFEPLASGRIAGARLSPQPDDAVPRFDYEGHLRSVVIECKWPQSTRQISELRVVIDYQSGGGAMRTLTLDIVDYPGESLLDLPLLDRATKWSAALAQLRWTTRRRRPSVSGSRPSIDPFAPPTSLPRSAARLFTDYLQPAANIRHWHDRPGRFHASGDLAGSPADLRRCCAGRSGPPSGSAWAMMRRY
jgi:predicted YcjX-like family ATPase